MKNLRFWKNDNLMTLYKRNNARLFYVYLEMRIFSPNNTFYKKYFKVGEIFVHRHKFRHNLSFF